MAETTTINLQQPPAAIPTDAFGLALAAHALSMQTSTEMRMHRDECNKRDERNEKTFTETKANIAHVETKLDEQTETILSKLEAKLDQQREANKWLYMIVGGLILLGTLLPIFAKKLGL